MAEPNRRRRDERKPPSTNLRRRRVTVYDAVAERVNANGFIRLKESYEPEQQEEEDEEDIPAGSTQDRRTGKPVRPDEALFRQRNAPERYEEDDMYEADRHLGPGRELPDSDLLKAIHCYASDYFDRATKDGGNFDFKQMDGSALLACGILLEEACKNVLGRDGDLVFTMAEPMDVATDDASPTTPSSSSSSSFSNDQDSTHSSDVSGSSSGTRSSGSDGSVTSEDD